MSFEIGGGRKQLHPTRDLDNALLAFALCDARRRHVDAETFGGAVKRDAYRRIDPVSIDRDGAGSALRRLPASRAPQCELDRAGDLLGASIALLRCAAA